MVLKILIRIRIQIRVANKQLTCNAIGLHALEGVRVKLVRSGPDYTDFLYDCYQNDQFMDLYRLAQNRTLTKDAIYQRLSDEKKKLPQELKRIEWIVLKIDASGERPIGLGALADYQQGHQRGEFLLGIPNSSYQKTTLSLEASLLILEFAFQEAKLHKLVSFVYGYNKNAQKNTLHLGFKQEGLLKEHLHTPQGFIDLFQNGLLLNDFRHNKQLARLSLRLLGRDITLPPALDLKPISSNLLETLERQLQTKHSL